MNEPFFSMLPAPEGGTYSNLASDVTPLTDKRFVDGFAELAAVEDSNGKPFPLPRCEDIG